MLSTFADASERPSAGGASPRQDQAPFQQVRGRQVLDLDYEEDAAAAVDMNGVMAGSGQFVEVQGTGEEATFSEKQLTAMLKLARQGVRRLTEIEQNALARQWPFG